MYIRSKFLIVLAISMKVNFTKSIVNLIWAKFINFRVDEIAEIKVGSVVVSR